MVSRDPEDRWLRRQAQWIQDGDPPGKRKFTVTATLRRRFSGVTQTISRTVHSPFLNRTVAAHSLESSILMLLISC